MAFAFGTPTSNLGFGAAPKPAFGSNFSFGSNTVASTATTGFGGFGTAATAAPAFGATTSTTNSGFGGFGTPAATGTTGFGGFGTTTASTAPSIFGGTSAFGNPAQKPVFPATTSTGIGFGTGTTGFGTGTTGFGTSAPAFGTAAPAFGTGTSAFGAGTTGFGTGTAGFGTGTNTFGTGTPAFGGGTSTFGSSFGAGGSFGGFGSKPATSNAFGGFGAGLGTSTFGQPQQQQLTQQQQAGPQNANDALLTAVFNCAVFGDERDQVLAKWNFLQAKWGTGQAYYSAQAPPLELTQANPLCRFKAIGYSLLPNRDDRAGLVLLVFGKAEQEIKSQQAQLINMMTTILGNKPNLTVNVDSVQAISENKAQVVIFVLDRSNGSRILASELSAHLQSALPKQQLTSAGCLSTLPLLAPEPAPLRQYLETPPAGIDIRLWKQAQADNPNPAKYIPIPMVGFAELKWRAQCRGDEAERHAAWLSRCSAELRGLRARHAAAAASAAALRRRLATLQHCLLQVIVRQETSRRVGAALTPQEEALRARLDALHTQLAAPTLFNGRLSELLSQMRMQRCQSAIHSSERCQMDPGAQDDIKQFLSMQQKGMAHLMETAQKDLAHLRIIQEGMTRLLQGNVDG